MLSTVPISTLSCTVDAEENVLIRRIYNGIAHTHNMWCADDCHWMQCVIAVLGAETMIMKRPIMALESLAIKLSTTVVHFKSSTTSSTHQSIFCFSAKC